MLAEVLLLGRHVGIGASSRLVRLSDEGGLSLMDGVSLLAYPTSMRQRDAGDLSGSGTMMLASSYMTVLLS
jgi:hypothetical protein